MALTAWSIRAGIIVPARRAGSIATSEKSLLAEREKKENVGQTAHETPAEVGGCKHMRLPFDGLQLHLPVIHCCCCPPLFIQPAASCTISPDLSVRSMFMQYPCRRPAWVRFGCSLRGHALPGKAATGSRSMHITLGERRKPRPKKRVAVD